MAMSIIWTGMLIVAVIASLVGGCPQATASAALEGARAGITLSLSLAGALCLWSGVIHVLEQAGLNQKLSRLLLPALRRIFPESSRDEKALGCISANVSANLLGLGNAATPPGIAAVKRMRALSGTDTAGDEMCRLIVLNTASIQLIPTTVAAVRASCGSASPFDILPSVWVTSLCSVAAGLLAARLFAGIGEKHG